MCPDMWHLEYLGDNECDYRIDLRFLFEGCSLGSEPRVWLGLPDISDDLATCEHLDDWLFTYPPGPANEMIIRIYKEMDRIVRHWDEYCDWYWANKKKFRKLDTYDD